MPEQKKIVIVESPAKARTIGRILGKDYIVTASMGHIRDLPEKKLGVDIKNGFTPIYQETRKSVVQQLKEAVKNADCIYLASDPDREGEAIAWHLRETLQGKGTKASFSRVVFHEITPSAVNNAFQHPADLNMNLVDAQQARRILDRIVGYKVSERLWSKVQNASSAGRVQSVALIIVCTREREILAFKSQEFWTFMLELEADPKGSGRVFTAKLSQIDGKKVDVNNEADAEGILKAVKAGSDLHISNIEIKPRKKNAPPPFITSTMQQSAGQFLRFSASHTMRVAQDLYEGIELGSAGPVGLITYMRTDSFTIAKEAQAACRNYISSDIGPEYVPDSPNFFRNTKNAQEAHEAIRPTDVTRSPKDIEEFLNSDQLKLYTLIWKRFIASQMKAAEQSVTAVDSGTTGSDGKNYIFRTSSTVTTFAGFTKIYDLLEKEKSESDSDEEQQQSLDAKILSSLAKDQKLFILSAEKEQKFTEPPPRYSEATLIRELESNGIGRPSTYATIVNTIQNRKYVLKTKGKLSPTELGLKVNDYLAARLPELFQIGFTAAMEKKLDDIEEGEVEWKKMLEEFYGHFSNWVGEAKNFGAPAKDKTESLINMIDGIKNWKEPEKKGRRTYNDKKFFESVKGQFEKNGIVSEKQWGALIALCSSYKDQLPELEKTFADLAIEEKKDTPASEGGAQPADPVENEKFRKILSTLAGLQLETEVTIRKRKYNDKKFINSLLRQAEDGRQLSPKQINAIRKIALKYKDSIPGFDAIADDMKASDNGQESEQKPLQNADEVKAAIEKLSTVTTWAEPTKKGYRTYDDKKFFTSLARQFEEKKNLSEKQVAALLKILGKYSGEQK